MFLENGPTIPAPRFPRKRAPTGRARKPPRCWIAKTPHVRPRLSHFLETWLNVPRPTGGVAAFVADVWSARLVAPDATLTTLLAGSTADPRRHGILTDAQVLAARAGSSGAARG